MKLSTFKRLRAPGKGALTAMLCAAGLSIPNLNAQTLTSNSTGTHGGFYYTFWKDSGDASMTLQSGGRYSSQWGNSTNNWVGGKGWNPGGPRTVSYSGSYNVDNSQNSYLALYGWTRNPLVEYYVIESYGSYNPSSCTQGRQTHGSFQSDGATYNVVRCQRVQQPSIEGTATFDQYFSVRQSKKGFGNISGTITVANHFAAWQRAGLRLGSHDYMVLATEGYQSRGSSDITVRDGGGGSSSSGSSSSSSTGGGSSSSSGGGTSTPSSTNIIVRARGAAGGENINLRIGGSTVASWNLTTSFANYTYTGRAAGDIQVEFTNDGGSRDAILDTVYVNGETRRAADMEYNTATYSNGQCGGGAKSGTMHCNGVIGFGGTGACFSGSCNGGNSGGSNSSSSGSSSSSSSSSTSTSGGSNGGNGNIVVRARGTSGAERINLKVAGSTVASWTLGTSMQNYTYNGGAQGDILVEFTNDADGRDVILETVQVNGETRRAADMRHNTATYGNGRCGGGSNSGTMHCSGEIGFGFTYDCFSGRCNN